MVAIRNVGRVAGSRRPSKTRRSCVRHAMSVGYASSAPSINSRTTNCNGLFERHVMSRGRRRGR